MTTTIVSGLDPGAGQININGRTYSIDGAGNFTIPLEDATALFGLGLVRQVIACASADRPTEDSGATIGMMVLDTDLNRPIWYVGTDVTDSGWIDANSADAAP